MPFTATVLTMFPEAFPGPLGVSLIGTSWKEQDLWRLETLDIRGFSKDKRGFLDDTPAGGGPGQVRRADVIASALDSVERRERPRPRVLRMLQKPVFETLLVQRGRLPQHTGDQPDARLDRHHRRRLATGQDRVSDGDLLEPPGVEHPLVHPFEPAAQDDNARSVGPLFRARLG